MARPRKEIDKKQFEQLCAMQCTEDEICAFFDVTDKTLTNWCKREYKQGFSDVFKQKRQKGHISLRRHQFELAKTNPTMAIFLGKNYLGQKDKQDEELGAEKLQELLQSVVTMQTIAAAPVPNRNIEELE